MDIKQNINQSCQVFDKDLQRPEYNRLLSDDEQLAALVKMMDIQPGCRYLDLATGNGYIAFELAQKFKSSLIDGLDITPKTIELNQAKQQELGLDNLSFMAFDGIKYPFETLTFSGIVTRYAFHHFPDPTSSLNEISRILKPGGFFLICDPYTLDDDDNGFIDRFQKIRPDGHIHFYKQNELKELLTNHGFYESHRFYNQITYPRKMNNQYLDLIKMTPASVLDRYEVKVVNDEVFITTQVMNILFSKQD